MKPVNIEWNKIMTANSVEEREWREGRGGNREAKEV